MAWAPQQIAYLELGQIFRHHRIELLRRRSWDLHSGHRPGIGGEPGTVESAGLVAGPLVERPHLGKGGEHGDHAAFVRPAPRLIEIDRRHLHSGRDRHRQLGARLCVAEFGVGFGGRGGELRFEGRLDGVGRDQQRRSAAGVTGEQGIERFAGLDRKRVDRIAGHHGEADHAVGGTGRRTGTRRYGAGEAERGENVVHRRSGGPVDHFAVRPRALRVNFSR